ncbi:MAG TPA: adenine deaminase [Acidimicrobiales bacterium]|jgi:adenine deaminase|nr:adenine deaminase [Acidimicrobiales bacterium]
MARRPSSPHVLAVARGDAPADVLLRGGRVLSPATREWVTTDLALAEGVVAGWGRRDALEEIDLDGAAVTAGLVDAHMHLESTKLWVDEFVRTVLPLGTTAVAADPHEVANVFGIPGVAALIAAARDLPFTFGVCASSCVPASPFESPGADLFAPDVAALLDDYAAIGVAEVMNFPGVIAGDPEMLARIATAGHRRVDGHAPGLSGPALDAYLAAGVESDHECTELEEAEEKRRKGMWIFIRQGSASQNLLDLIPTVLAHGTNHVALCSDDREPDTLLEVGHLNDCVRLAVEAGVSEVDALIMATLNPAEYHGFTELGALGPGYQADILCFDTLAGFRPSRVFQRGRLVARDGAVVPGAVPDTPPPAFMRQSVHLPTPPPPSAFDSGHRPGARVRTIGIHEGSLTTAALITDPSDPALLVARLAVVERHRQTGRIGLGWVQGFGLSRGALASTVGHDAHNCMAVGSSSAQGPVAMAAAVARLAEIGGGQVAVDDEGRVLAELPLPIGGLMSDWPAHQVAASLHHLVEAARTLGTTISAPFMHMSFLGLSVIPELRLTDKGLVDVGKFELVPVAVD